MRRLLLAYRKPPVDVDNGGGGGGGGHIPIVYSRVMQMACFFFGREILFNINNMLISQAKN